jgi:hypothetical protein
MLDCHIQEYIKDRKGIPFIICIYSYDFHLLCRTFEEGGSPAPINWLNRVYLRRLIALESQDRRTFSTKLSRSRSELTQTL